MPKVCVHNFTDRSWREEYEGRNEKGGGESREDESRKWNEGPSGEVERNGLTWTP
jgi:hypothetical protein